MANIYRTMFNDIEGTNDNDTLNGGDDRDRIRGRAGDDLIFGNGGDDVLGGGSGEDTIYGGTGNDFIYPGQDGKKTYYGEEGDDRINGLYSEDTLRGGPGNDTLNGGINTDWLFGGEGNDRLEISSDFAEGGDGADTFAFTISSRTTTTPEKISVIEDFNPDEGDKIEINYVKHFPVYEPEPVIIEPVVAVAEFVSSIAVNSALTVEEATIATDVQAVDSLTNSDVDSSNLTTATDVQAVAPLTNSNVDSSNKDFNQSIDFSDFKLNKIDIDLENINFDPNIEIISLNNGVSVNDVSYNSETGALFLKDIQFAQLSPGLDLVPEQDVHVETIYPFY
ncbi:MAG: calcium-binding protein [Okeania sp. SIO2F4]|uniref:calcium-binding protein n=1 Tax=Okeania sp. SIO2F4 TaxID=2607790 RepID=UPI00142C0000|nr:calcium-binding protein [Okeania sp. SIO2F4]NES02109.1 calcium-binding protein [Okeania sp. SIO2F4]